MIVERSPADAARWLRRPGARDDKYRRGVLGVRTGSAQFPGAAVLGVLAAWRSGVGLLRYVPTIDNAPAPAGLPSPAAAVLAAAPETVFGEAGSARACDAWLIGSGTDPGTRSPAETDALRALLAGDAPVVVDAGALALAAARHGTTAPGQPAAAAPRILTPHAGEFARLWRACELGEPPAALADPEAIDARAAATLRLAEALDATVLLKGSRTIAAAPGGAPLVSARATPWLATAGTGDVLAGALGALLAGHAAEVRADPALLAELGIAAAHLHDRAARLASGPAERPITAGDVARALGDAFAELAPRA